MTLNITPISFNKKFPQRYLDSEKYNLLSKEPYITEKEPIEKIHKKNNVEITESLKAQYLIKEPVYEPTEDYNNILNALQSVNVNFETLVQARLLLIRLGKKCDIALAQDDIKNYLYLRGAKDRLKSAIVLAEALVKTPDTPWDEFKIVEQKIK